MFRLTRLASRIGRLPRLSVSSRRWCGSFNREEFDRLKQDPATMKKLEGMLRDHPDIMQHLDRMNQYMLKQGLLDNTGGADPNKIMANMMKDQELLSLMNEFHQLLKKHNLESELGSLLNMFKTKQIDSE